MSRILLSLNVLMITSMPIPLISPQLKPITGLFSTFVCMLAFCLNFVKIQLPDVITGK